MDIGNLMYSWVEDLFPINRSLTGSGVRETLRYIKNLIPELNIYEIPSHTKCFDWNVPLEWNVSEAYLANQNGEKIIDFKKNNLHLVGYSIPIKKEVSFNELEKNLHYLKSLPNAIPYVTSYYSKNWGFCLTYNQFQQLNRDENYYVHIDTSLSEGVMNYAELIIKGESEKEIFLSTYICHPSMANNELSGPAVTTALIKFIKSLPNRKYTYRIVFIPETIGSICYLSKNISHMKKNVIAGFNVTTIGDDLIYSYVPSRNENSLADRAALHILNNSGENVKYYTFFDRASDERQYCFPGVDLPVVTVCRSKYLEYPEYHTSLDNLDFISPKGLEGGYEMLKNILILLENNEYYRITTICEPQLGKRGLYPNMSTKDSYYMVKTMMNFITYADGEKDLIEIADLLKVNVHELYDTINKLKKTSLLEIMKPR